MINVIYKIYLVDGDSGILMIENTFKAFSKGKNLEPDLLTGFFQAVNSMIDDIQFAMAKGRRINDMNRIVAGEDSTIVIYYHPLSRVLFCSISDADDDKERLIEILRKIGSRFWKKHQRDLKNFRTTSNKNEFESFDTDIDVLSMGGHAAEILPKLIVAKSALERIKSMGMITKEEVEIAMLCDGENSPLQISRDTESLESEIRDILKKLENLDIIKY